MTNNIVFDNIGTVEVRPKVSKGTQPMDGLDH